MTAARPASAVLHRNLVQPLPMAVKGEGVYIFDAEGKSYIDASGGPAVSSLGHSHPRVIAAIRRQLDDIAFAYAAFFTSPAIEALARRLVDAAPPGLSHAFFVSGGSEANEAAMKLARQYFLEIGEPKRRLFVARERSYHGNTLGALALGGDAVRRQPYEPLLIDVAHVAPCYEYRNRLDGETPEAYGARLAQDFEATLLRLGPENVAAFFVEPVVGASLGCAPPVPGYLKAVREICDRHGVLLVFDEVMCGMGRTGHLYACAEDGVTPDILTLAKGLGAGYQPIGAYLAQEKIVTALRSGSGFLRHGHTYAGHTLACAAALAVQEAIAEENLLARVRHLGGLLRSGLEARFGQHPHVGDIRGRGLFQAIELVADRESKTSFAPERKIWQRVKEAGLANGLICYPSGGCIDGRRGDTILLAPPFIATEAQIGEILDKLDLSLKSALA